MDNRIDILNETAIRLLEAGKGKTIKSFGMPIEDVVECMRDTKLQSQHDVQKAIAHYGDTIKNPPEDCLWFWFESPDWTWEQLCGRAGWFVISKSNLRFIDFFLERMN